MPNQETTQSSRVEAAARSIFSSIPAREPEPVWVFSGVAPEAAPASPTRRPRQPRPAPSSSPAPTIEPILFHDSLQAVINAAVGAGVFNHYSRPLEAISTLKKWLSPLSRQYHLKRSSSDTILSIARNRWSNLSSGTINRRIALLNLAIKHHDQTYLDEERIGYTVKMLPERSKKIVWFDERTVERLIDQSYSISPEFSFWVMFMAYTGCRVSEANSLLWKDIELGKIHLWDTKGGPNNARTIPMNGFQGNLIRFGERTGRDKSMPGPFTDFTNNRVSYLWSKLRSLVYMAPETSPHTLRHTCASRMVQKGVPLAVIKEWMGHSDIKMTMRYAHIEPSQQLVDAANTSAYRGTVRWDDPISAEPAPVPSVQQVPIPSYPSTVSVVAPSAASTDPLIAATGPFSQFVVIADCWCPSCEIERHHNGEPSQIPASARIPFPNDPECDPMDHSPRETHVRRMEVTMQPVDFTTEVSAAMPEAVQTRFCTCPLCRYRHGTIDYETFIRLGGQISWLVA